MVQGITDIAAIKLTSNVSSITTAKATANKTESNDTKNPISLQQSPSAAKKGNGAAGQRIVEHNFLVCSLLLL